LERVSRRRLLAAGGGAVLAGAVVGQTVANAQADRPERSPWGLTFDVVLEAAPAAAAPAAGAPAAAAPAAEMAMQAGAFYMSGAVYEAGSLGADGTPGANSKRVGTLRVWGWNFDPSRPGATGSVANASLELTRRGQFVLGGGVVADHVGILAGTGEFRGANGQAALYMISANAARVVLDYSSPYAGT